MVVLFSFSVNIPDYSAYKYFYDNNGDIKLLFINGETSSVVFSYYALFFKNLGLNYDFFRLITFSVISIISFLFLKNKIEVGLLVCAYALVPFFFDMCQVRFFLSEIFCFWAIYALTYNRRVFFFILIGLATYIHSMNVLWLLVYFIPLNLEWTPKTLKKSFVTIGVFFLLLFASAPLIGYLQNIVSWFVFFNEYSRYMEMSVRYGYLLYVGYQIINVIVAVSLLLDVLQLKTIGLWQKKITTLNYFVQIFGILFIILTMMNVNFSRYFRMLFILNALAFSAVSFSRNQSGFINKTIIEKRSNQVMNAILYSLMIGIWLFGEIKVNGSFVNILNTIDQNFPNIF